LVARDERQPVGLRGNDRGQRVANRVVDETDVGRS